MVTNDRPPANTARSRIRTHVYTHPGVHFNQLVRDLDLATGQVQYHLRRLSKAGEVVDTPLYGRTHYFSPEFEAWERGVLALARRETAREILFYLLEVGPARPTAVASELEIARSTLEWHLDRLIEQDIVEKRRDDGAGVTIEVTDRTRIVRLLTHVTPTVSDRLADRFMSFVDALFDPEDPSGP